MDVKRFLHLCQSPALQLADLENVVYQGQQMLCGHTDLLPALTLPLRVILAFLHDSQHSQNPVDGCTQIMRQGKGGFWQKQQHIYNSPFYYIDYSLAQSCALQYKVKMDEDFDAAWASYLKLCRLSASDFFTNMVKEVGLMSPFEPGCIKNIVEKLEKYVK